MNLLREYIRVLVEQDGLIMIPPPPPFSERVRELKLVRDQYHNRVNDPDMQDALDADIALVFNIVLMSAGHDDMHKEIVELRKSIVPIIKFHKQHFKQLRPHELAKKVNYPFEYDYLESAQTPSYPSGHTTQAFYLAHKLSEMFPDVEKDLFAVANMVAHSRIDRGVHFPSDNEAGKILALSLSRLT